MRTLARIALITMTALATMGCQDNPFRLAPTQAEKQRLDIASEVAKEIVRDGTPPKSVAGIIIDQALASASAKAGRPASPSSSTRRSVRARCERVPALGFSETTTRSASGGKGAASSGKGAELRAGMFMGLVEPGALIVAPE